VAYSAIVDIKAVYFLILVGGFEMGLGGLVSSLLTLVA
jgi:hypothetical protein